jgi:hypothetical protein
LFRKYLIEKVRVEALGDESLHVDFEIFLELRRLTPAPPTDLPASMQKLIQTLGMHGYR